MSFRAARQSTLLFSWYFLLARWNVFSREQAEAEAAPTTIPERWRTTSARAIAALLGQGDLGRAGDRVVVVHLHQGAPIVHFGGRQLGMDEAQQRLPTPLVFVGLERLPDHGVPPDQRHCFAEMLTLRLRGGWLGDIGKSRHPGTSSGRTSLAREIVT